MKKPEQAFIDPSVVSPRKLNNAEMTNLSGGILFTAVVWATSCGNGFAILVVVVASTEVDV